MDSFQQFLEGLSKGPCDERVIIFRHEALRPLNFAKGYAKLLELGAASDTGLPEDAPELFEKLLSSLAAILNLK